MFPPFGSSRLRFFIPSLYLISFSPLPFPYSPFTSTSVTSCLLFNSLSSVLPFLVSFFPYLYRLSFPPSLPLSLSSLLHSSLSSHFPSTSCLLFNSLPSVLPFFVSSSLLFTFSHYLLLYPLFSSFLFPLVSPPLLPFLPLLFPSPHIADHLRHSSPSSLQRQSFTNAQSYSAICTTFVGIFGVFEVV